MAKKLKKRKKLTRRARQGTGAAHTGRPAANASASSAAPTTAPPAPKNAATTHRTPAPAPTPPAETPPAAAAASTPPSSAGAASAAPAVGFRATTRRGPDGIDSKLAASEYPAVRKDLRKLGLTVTFFVAVLAGLTVLGNSTSVISDLGSELFKLWR